MTKNSSQGNSITVTFWGAARTVTGSMHLLASGRHKILLDCGLFQGRRAEAYACKASKSYRHRSAPLLWNALRIG